MKNLKKILIANRGEIAVRVIRTAKKMGYATVAVYSAADAKALHVTMADESVLVGEAVATKSYLNIENIIKAAKSVAADAIHPGYGFLSENTQFAEACADANIVFIGPPINAINLMGSKRLSKLAMLENKVPCIPGYQGSDQDDQCLLEEAQKIGLPLMIKASAGGGGRGMRLVHDASNIKMELNAARSEALSAFGSDEVILERAIIEPRHIEIQVFADMHGNIVHLGERDCSIQRRHQKVVEESPSPFVSEDLRTKMGEAAINAAKACDYVGAGTVEFLVDADEHFYFLEMNTRLQVEHPVTEMVTGLDLVEWQLRVATGEKLPLKQDQIQFTGHAIEVRVYAEDPRQSFIPQTGQALVWDMPDTDGVRIDNSIQAGQTISAFYDPMLAKVIAHDLTRHDAIKRLTNALNHTILLGVNHNVHFLNNVLRRDRFIKGAVTTAFLGQEYPDEIYQQAIPDKHSVAIAGLLIYRNTQLCNQRYQPEWTSAVPLESKLRLGYSEQVFNVSISHIGENYTITVDGDGAEYRCPYHQAYPSKCLLIHGGRQFTVDYAFLKNRGQGDHLFLQDEHGHFEFIDLSYKPAVAKSADGGLRVKASMDGAIVEVLVAEGDEVKAGQVVAILEAMKMAHPLKAEVSGMIDSLACSVGQQVKSRQVLATIKRGD